MMWNRLFFIALVSILSIYDPSTGLSIGNSGNDTPAVDPCNSSPCGRGADCQTKHSMTICTCPLKYTGDPFVECIPPAQAATSSPITSTITTHSEVHTPGSFFVTNSNPNTPTTTAFTSTFQTQPFADIQTSTDYRPTPIRGTTHPAVSFTNPIQRPDHSNNDRNVPMTSTFQTDHANRGFFQDRNSFLNNHHATGNHEGSLANKNNNYGHGQGKPHEGSGGMQNSFIKDPMGQYSNCRSINGIVVCADLSADDSMASMQSGNDNSLVPFGNLGNSQPTFPPGSYNFMKELGNPSYPNPTQQNSNHFNSDLHKPISSSGAHHHQRFDTPTAPLGGSGHRHSLNGDSLCKSMCGVNSVCRLILNRPVCGCPEGHTGDPSVRCVPIEGQNNGEDRSRCQQHTECPPSQVCLKAQCVDPCNMSSPEQRMSLETSHVVNSGMCGTNARCMVIEHTPLCGCVDGYFGNPYVGCAT